MPDVTISILHYDKYPSARFDIELADRVLCDCEVVQIMFTSTGHPVSVSVRRADGEVEIPWTRILTCKAHQ